MLTIPPDEALHRAREHVDRARAAERSGATGAAIEWFDRAASCFGVGEGSSLLADVLRWKGTLLRDRGETLAARLCYERSLEVCDAMQYREGRAHALNCLGIVAQRRGELTEAERLYNDAALIAVGTGERRLLAMVQQNLGVVANVRGDMDVALVRYRMALRLFQEIGDDEAQSWVLNNLGKLGTDRRQFAEATDAFARGLALARARGDVRVEQALELNRVEMLVAAESWAEAEAGSVLALHSAEQREDRVQRGQALKFIGVCARQRADLDRAVASLETARSCANETQDALLLAEVLFELGETLRAQDRRGEARDAWQRAIALFREIGAAHEAGGVQSRMQLLA